MMRYSERVMELNVPPPFLMEDVTAWVAMKHIGWGSAQKWVDETLNWRPPGSAKPDEIRFIAGPLAAIVFIKVGAMRSLDPAYADWPAMQESEMHVTIPVFEEGLLGLPNLLKPRFFPLTLVLDSSPAMIAGREVYGFPKISGQVTTGNRSLGARSEVYCKKGDKLTVVNELVVGMERDRPGDDDDLQDQTVQECLYCMAKESLEGAPRQRSEEKSWLEACGSAVFDECLELFAVVFSKLLGPQEFVFLKQFRDQQDATRAAYRAVTEVPVSFSNIRSLHRLGGDWKLEVPEHQSSELLKEVGLGSGPIGCPLRVKFDFELPMGRTIWSG
jgi:hypothetical protein